MKKDFYNELCAAFTLDDNETIATLLQTIETNDVNTEIELPPLEGASKSTTILPLSLAAMIGSEPASKYLIENGADIHTVITKDELKGQTPLLLAIGYGHIKLAESLINKGANVNAMPN
jgi:ankyrin repeat protein